jgi:hypothetical protein
MSRSSPAAVKGPLPPMPAFKQPPPMPIRDLGAGHSSHLTKSCRLERMVHRRSRSRVHYGPSFISNLARRQECSPQQFELIYLLDRMEDSGKGMMKAPRRPTARARTGCCALRRRAKCSAKITANVVKNSKSRGRPHWP